MDASIPFNLEVLREWEDDSKCWTIDMHAGTSALTPAPHSPLNNVSFGSLRTTKSDTNTDLELALTGITPKKTPQNL